MSSLQFQCKPSPIRELYKAIYPLSILGIVFIFVGFLSKYLMDHGLANCEYNGSRVDCSEIWWVPWIFIGIGAVFTFTGFIGSKVFYNRCKQMTFNFYTDYIECCIRGRQVAKYNILPCDHVFISPQTTKQERSHVATILIETSSPIEVSSITFVTSQTYMILPNIPNYQYVCQKICDLYHLEPKKTIPKNPITHHNVIGIKR